MLCGKSLLLRQPLRAYKVAFEQAAIPLEVWVRWLFWLCMHGGNVMVGTIFGLVGLLRAA